MRDAIAAAGLPLACKPHGLRKATGRRLAEAGATAKMIMAILGHTTLTEAERYTEEADRERLFSADRERLNLFSLCRAIRANGWGSHQPTSWSARLSIRLACGGTEK